MKNPKRMIKLRKKAIYAMFSLILITLTWALNSCDNDEQVCVGHMKDDSLTYFPLNSINKWIFKSITYNKYDTMSTCNFKSFGCSKLKGVSNLFLYRWLPNKYWEQKYDTLYLGMSKDNNTLYILDSLILKEFILFSNFTSKYEFLLNINNSGDLNRCEKIIISPDTLIEHPFLGMIEAKICCLYLYDWNGCWPGLKDIFCISFSKGIGPISISHSYDGEREFDKWYLINYE